MLSFAIAVIFVTGLLAWLACRFLRLERRMTAAVMLTSMFMNAGNYGLPLVNFAFGQDALVYAGLFYVGMNTLLSSLGVLIASLGTSNLKQSLLNLAKIPAIYAVLLGILFLGLGWELPMPVERTIEILGNAAIPCMLVFMGMQFHNMKWEGRKLPVLLVSGIRLVAAPALALVFGSVFHLPNLAIQAGVVESGMPSAVLTTIVATEYDIEPSFVTAVVFISTLLSPITLTPLLYYLGA